MDREKPCCIELARFLSPKLFRALGDSNRVLLLARLAQSRSEQTVSEVAQEMPIDLSVVSRHLAVLRDAGILEARKRGREVFYSVRIEALAEALRALAEALEACCPPEKQTARMKGGASVNREIDQ